MKRLIALVVAGAFAVATPAFAENAQQERMKTCNVKAGDKKGDERKTFMKDCLSAEKLSQQDKMKACNQKAGEMKGDERKKFMSTCLKG
jgi:psiF repeat-containing protein